MLKHGVCVCGGLRGDAFNNVECFFPFRISLNIFFSRPTLTPFNGKNRNHQINSYFSFLSVSQIEIH